MILFGFDCVPVSIRGIWFCLSTLLVCVCFLFPALIFFGVRQRRDLFGWNDADVLLFFFSLNAVLFYYFFVTKLEVLLIVKVAVCVLNCAGISIVAWCVIL